MTIPLRVLIVEDQPADAELVLHELRRAGFAPDARCVENEPDYLKNLEPGLDLILSDYSMPQFDGRRALQLLQESGLDIPFIIVSGTIGEDLAVVAMKEGAADYLLKDRLGRLGQAVTQALEQKQFRARMRQAQEQIRDQAALIDRASDAILVRDSQERIIFWNRGAERLYGWTASEAIGRNVDELLYHGPAVEFHNGRKALLGKGEWAGELRQVHRSGKEIVVASRWTLVRDEQGRPQSTLVINTDVTERRKLEAQLLRNQRLESIGTLAGGIAHDLNNILTPILLAVELLRMKVKDAESESMLTTLHSSAARGAQLVKQVLSFARGAEGQRQVVPLRPLLTEISKLLQETLPRSIDVLASIQKELWPVSGDPTRLHQVVMNLCVNAWEAMPQGGRLTISARNCLLDESDARMHRDGLPGAYVLVSVEDTGMGIPADIIDKIFDPFFTTKESGKGTGLGLSTVRSIVKSTGGFIHIHSEVGRGSRFAVYLPAAEALTSQAVEPERLQVPTGHGELALVVDDELSIREITRAILEAAGYRVEAAQDGAEAVALYAQHRAGIRVVVTDMMMPIMEGPAAIRAMQKIDPGVRVIATTGLNESDKAAEALSLGVRAVLAKPFTADQLLTAMAEVLR